MAKNGDTIHVATRSFTAESPDGVRTFVKKDATRVADGHWLLAANPGAFAPLDTTSTIETATAAPGEKRGAPSPDADPAGGPNPQDENPPPPDPGGENRGEPAGPVPPPPDPDIRPGQHGGAPEGEHGDAKPEGPDSAPGVHGGEPEGDPGDASDEGPDSAPGVRGGEPEAVTAPDPNPEAAAKAPRGKAARTDGAGKKGADEDAKEKAATKRGATTA